MLQLLLQRFLQFQLWSDTLLVLVGQLQEFLGSYLLYLLLLQTVLFCCIEIYFIGELVSMNT